MDIESFRNFCLHLKGVEETQPFGPDTLVYKVMGKVFAITGLDEEDFSVNLKCDPEKSIELRETFPGRIIPGFHMNKKHWNTVLFEQGLPHELLIQLINHSYQLVIEGLPLKLRQALQQADE
ncbi:MAG TPA: MmcQ/YjbR family DNA-binding protein [Saprospiraceae bacterium]|jgi:predicted DNA-binding protein (MmcQ/YjbR family)